MARVQPSVPTTDDLDLICLVLAGDGQVLWGNAPARALGRSRPGLTRYLRDLVHPDDLPTAADLLDVIAADGRGEGILRFRDSADGPCYLHLRMARGKQGAGIPDLSSRAGDDGLVVQGWNVTDLIMRQQELESQVFRDPLTGVPNRLAFMARLDQELSLPRLPRHQVAVLFVDVDDFKVVNDTYGHETGDRVLAELAERLAASIRPSDLLGRIGGDEFAIVCPDLIGWPAVTLLIDRLRSIAAEPISTPHGMVSVTISLGAAFAEEASGQHGASELVARADQRMFQTKQAAPAAATAATRR
jgi:diguanylate cyclase (GGDEF)-like protein